MTNVLDATADENSPVVIEPVYKQKPLRFLAWIISFIFHPLFISAYVGYYIIFLHPRYFSGYNHEQRFMVMVRLLINMVGFPVVAVLLLKGVGFIDSVLLKTQKDSIIPYMACGIFFFWMYLVFRNQPDIPSILTSFIFGVFLASSAALIANIYYKISMHAIGCGGMIGILLVMLFHHPLSPATVPLMISLLISGMVCTSRMILGSHSQKEIYMGLLVGGVFQWISATFLM